MPHYMIDSYDADGTRRKSKHVPALSEAGVLEEARRMAIIQRTAYYLVKLVQLRGETTVFDSRGTNGRRT